MERREKMKAEKKAKYEAWLERKKKREDFRMFKFLLLCIVYHTDI